MHLNCKKWLVYFRIVHDRLHIYRRVDLLFPWHRDQIIEGTNAFYYKAKQN